MTKAILDNISSQQRRPLTDSLAISEKNAEFNTNFLNLLDGFQDFFAQSNLDPFEKTGSFDKSKEHAKVLTMPKKPVMQQSSKSYNKCQQTPLKDAQDTAHNRKQLSSQPNTKVDSSATLTSETILTSNPIVLSREQSLLTLGNLTGEELQQMLAQIMQEGSEFSSHPLLAMLMTPENDANTSLDIEETMVEHSSDASAEKAFINVKELEKIGVAQGKVTVEMLTMPVSMKPLDIIPWAQNTELNAGYNFEQSLTEASLYNTVATDNLKGSNNESMYLNDEESVSSDMDLSTLPGFSEIFSHTASSNRIILNDSVSRTSFESVASVQANKAQLHTQAESAALAAKDANMQGTIDKLNVLNQVKSEMAQALKSGNSHLLVHLNPDELGKVTIRFDLTKDGTAMASFTAENRETMETLVQHVAEITRVFEEAGLQTHANDLQFSFQDQNSSADRQPAAPDFFGQLEGKDTLEPETKVQFKENDTHNLNIHV